jgi:hypothetical protein
MEMRPLVIYHGGCRDGFAAAWAASCALRGRGGADYHAGYYGQPPPDVRGREVYVVDFSYPRETLEQMHADAAWLIVLDHHKTAQAAMEGLSFARFDMNRSGAGMTWDWFARETGEVTDTRPWLIDYVEDRDLWRHALPHSHEVNAWIGSLAFDLAAWDAAHADMAQDAVEVGDPLRAAVIKGKAIIAKTQQYVREVSKNARRVSFAGFDNIPLVNAPQVDISELLDHLGQGEPIAMGWWQRADGVFQYSLRSREPSEVDVSEIAKRYGGGGHKRAAGFQVEEMVDFGKEATR